MKGTLLAALLPLAGCVAPQEPAPPAEPAANEPIAVTRWSDATELFAEYPALRVNRTSRFAIHLTDLRSFQPLTAGRVTVYLDHGGGHVETFAADGPSRPGIFGVDVAPSRPGRCELAIGVRSGSLVDRHLVGKAVVAVGEGPAADAPPDGSGEPAPGGVTFLKEQQWTLDFATQRVGVRPMRESVTVSASVEPRSGGRTVVAAPASGRLLASLRLPALGDAVQQGQKIAAVVPAWTESLDPTALHLRVDEAGVELEAALRDLDRVERLLAAGAVPARRAHEAKARTDVAAARKKAAEERLARYEAVRADDPHVESQSAFLIRSHLAGTVTSVRVTDGSHVEEGDILLEIAATDFVHVSGAVPEAQAALLSRLRGAEILVPGSEVAVPVRALVSTARVVDPDTRTLKATYLLDNRKARLALGQLVRLRLFTSDAVESPAVPEAALVDDLGRTLVYVQTGGESFDERPVVVGSREAGEVQIVRGLVPGERVVTRGAYLLRLAAETPEGPAHGHVH